ncbi:MAG TPA: cyclic nucleotide-binding domain-containing protein [Candidatus Limnocylindrales bacterium]|jgi:CRP-like cAMP-binding protein|nr:cyclic nucleotide-binding domain-containing protein [Candidatus Limnocylindrales bacterium]
MDTRFGTLEELIANRFAADLPASGRRALARIARLEVLAPGTVALREGRPTERLGVVIDGRLSVRTRVPGHPDVTLLTLEPGDVFGWSAVLDGTATSSVVALRESTVMVFDRGDLMRVVEGNAGVAAVVYRRLLKTVADRLVRTRLQLLDVYGPGRVAR